MKAPRIISSTIMMITRNIGDNCRPTTNSTSPRLAPVKARI